MKLSSLRVLAALVVTGTSLGVAAERAEAQWGPRIGVGYVASAPHQYLGLSAHVLTRQLGGLGLYVDAKMSHSTPSDRENFESDWNAQYVDDNFGDLPFGGDSEYRSVNAALMRPVTPELILYAGAGITERTSYVEYLDENEERGRNGFYWVEDDDAGATGLNLLAGAFFRIGRNVSLQFGLESEPRGATVGASYAVPIGR